MHSFSAVAQEDACVLHDVISVSESAFQVLGFDSGTSVLPKFKCN